MIEKDLEIWKDIKEWEDYYISNQGNVRHGEKKVALCPNRNRRNYVYVYHHRKEMKPKALSVHRLVARHFLPNPENKRCVNHIDNDTQNNRLENLEWSTHKENTNHAKRQGRLWTYRGSDCKRAILDESIVRNIKRELGKMTHMELARKYKTNYSNVAHIKRGTRWGHVTVDNHPLKEIP